FVAAALVAYRVFGGQDVDALRRTRRGAAQASDATGRPVLAEREAVQAAKALGIGPPLLGVAHRGDAFRDALQHRIGALLEGDLLGVVEEVTHRHFHALHDLGNEALRAGGALRSRHRLSDNSSLRLVGHGQCSGGIGAGLTPAWGSSWY